MTSLLVVAGEASGDLHAARLVAELRELHPGLETFGLGGDELAAEGLDALAHSAEIAVVGITEVLSVLPRAWQIYRQLLRTVDARRPDAALLVDFPEFNLRLARQLHRRGVPVVYYVSPQVWAWRRGRVRKIAQVVERMLVLFPFEVEFYRGAGVQAIHVGHPLVDEVPEPPHVWDREQEPGGKRLALLPGSRRSEVSALLPAMAGAAHLLAERCGLEPFIVRAPTVSRDWLMERLAETGGPPIEVVDGGDRFEHLADSRLALVASGTATLEVGLVGTPMVVCYRVGWASALLGRLLLDLPYISLVNLVLDRGAVPEVLQKDATADGIAREAESLLAAPERLAAMRAELAGLRAALGEGGGSYRAAKAVNDVLVSRGAA